MGYIHTNVHYNRWLNNICLFSFPKCCKEYVATKQQCANNINQRERERESKGRREA
jgi:hypothetical protein